MKTALLVSLLSAAATTAYFSGRIYLLLSEQKAQAVAYAQQQHDFWNNHGKTPALVPFTDQGLGDYSIGRKK